MSETPHYNVIAFRMLEAAGYKVTPTDIPGLWDIEGLARDVTLGQVRQLAGEHGRPWVPQFTALPIVRIGDMS
jgi:hypothetical protein